MTDAIHYQREGRIGQIILDRPTKLNALTDEMLHALHDAIIAFDEDPEAWVGIVLGRGRAFCSGADVQGRQMQPPEVLGRFGGAGGWASYLPDYFFRLTNWKPMIAAVHGHVLGMGLRLALLCEFIVAAEGTRFCITETQRGLDPTALWAHLDRRSTPGFANDVAMTGRTWLAEEAAQAGAVDVLAPAGEHLKAAEELALAIAANPPLSVRAVVEARRSGLERLEFERRIGRPRGLHLSHDFQEALAAFLNKRPPTFEGR
jgi:enoyl-CoA hydratase/carnithine racemase